MLDVCIPIYQHCIEDMLSQLLPQCVGENVQIILIDDHSFDTIHESNALTINKLSQKYKEKVKYIRLEENIGRARIRNLFLQYSRADYMLFLDCDAVIPSSDFINKYIFFIESGADVICGGRYYNVTTKYNNRLRLRYGNTRECRTAEQRTLNPYRSFQTNNFVIRRRLLQLIRFDETLEGYGHEDTLFGFRLKEHNAKIMHIVNPVVSQSVDDNKVFLQKTEQSIKNLKQIYFVTLDRNPDFVSDVALLQHYERLSSRNLIWIIKYSFKILRCPIKFLLSQGFASIGLYSYYKLGLFVQ